MKQGQILFDKYKIERALGSGGMGSVYLVTNLQLGNKWAVKHIKNSGIAFAEVEILKKLNHVSLPKIADAFEDCGGTYIVESYIEGTTLQNSMDTYSNIDIAGILHWVLQLCDVLEYLHNLKPHSIVYRDLKPTNIMVLKDNRLVLIDFGISKIHKASNRKDMLVAGTNAYAAPEQLVQGGFSDKRSDIYSLGVIMQELCKFSACFSDNTLKSRSVRLIKTIIGKCLEKIPENRYQNVEELRREIIKASEEFNMERAKDSILYRALIATSLITSLATYLLVFFCLKR